MTWFWRIENFLLFCEMTQKFQMSNFWYKILNIYFIEKLWRQQNNRNKDLNGAVITLVYVCHTLESWLLNSSNFCCSGVFSVSVSIISFRIFPKSIKINYIRCEKQYISDW